MDNGIKWLVAAHGEDGLRGTLPYLGHGLDPDCRNFPIASPFVWIVDGRPVSQYPPTFSLLSRPLLAAFGPAGGFLLPLLGAILAAWGAARLAAGWDRSAGIWAYLFAGPLGPLAWYGTTFWEHTLIASAVVWAALAWVRRPRAPVVSALLLAFATWMREGTVLLVPVILLLDTARRTREPREERPGSGFRRFRSGLIFLLTYAVAMTPFVLWQRSITGTTLGLHVGGNLAGTFRDILLSNRLAVVRGLLWSGDEGATEAGDLVLTLLAGLLVVVATRLVPGRLRTLGTTTAMGLMGAVALIAILALYREDDMPMTLIRTAGLLFFAPWIVACLAGTRGRDPILLWSAGLALFLFLTLTPAVTAFGFHWGPRVLLSALPLLAAAAALGMPRLLSAGSGALPRLGAAVLVVSCLLLQAYGGSLQAEVTRGSEAQLELSRVFVSAATPLSERGDDVHSGDGVRSEGPAWVGEDPLVTGEWWYAATFAPLLLERPIFRVRSSAELRDWVARFRRAGGRRFYWATTAREDGLPAGLQEHVVRSTTIEGYPQAYRHRLSEIVVD